MSDLLISTLYAAEFQSSGALGFANAVTTCLNILEVCDSFFSEPWLQYMT